MGERLIGMEARAPMSDPSQQRATDSFPRRQVEWGESDETTPEDIQLSLVLLLPHPSDGGGNSRQDAGIFRSFYCQLILLFRWIAPLQGPLDRKLHWIKDFAHPFFVGISLALALQTMKACSRSSTCSRSSSRSKGDTPCHL